jgi:hypothetical protein
MIREELQHPEPTRSALMRVPTITMGLQDSQSIYQLEQVAVSEAILFPSDLCPIGPTVEAAMQVLVEQTALAWSRAVCSGL